MRGPALHLGGRGGSERVGGRPGGADAGFEQAAKEPARRGLFVPIVEIRREIAEAPRARELLTGFKGERHAISFQWSDAAPARRVTSISRSPAAGVCLPELRQTVGRDVHLASASNNSIAQI